MNSTNSTNSTNSPNLTEAEIKSRDEFVERLLKSTKGVFDIFSIYLGDQLGFYQILSDSEPRTSIELASKTNANERYVREWLEQQTVAGILEVENPQGEPKSRRFRLPAPYAEVLAAKESLNYLPPLAQMLVAVTRPLPQLLNVYRSGEGIPYHDYGPDIVQGQAGINRTMFVKLIGTEWFPKIPDLHARLQQAPSAQIADIGCGAGWSSIGMARAYPNVRVEGFDTDSESIQLARDNAKEAGLNDRIQFHTQDASDPHLKGHYDLVVAFECLHDMSNPVDALITMRHLVNENGTVLIVDERVGDTFTPTGNDVEWMMYGWSVLHCLPVGMANQPSAATGTVMRKDTLRHYALEAGFRDIEMLPIENFFFRFYRLLP